MDGKDNLSDREATAKHFLTITQALAITCECLFFQPESFTDKHLHIQRKAFVMP